MKKIKIPKPILGVFHCLRLIISSWIVVLSLWFTFSVVDIAIHNHPDNGEYVYAKWNMVIYLLEQIGSDINA